MSSRRLYRCRHDRQLAGVAGGMAEYFDIDPTVVRVLWILSVFFGGFSLLLYLVLAVIIPLEPLPAAAGAVHGAIPTADDDATHVATDPAALTSTWAVPAGSVPAAGHQHRARGDGRLGLAVGVLLVVFGSIALVGPLFPGWLTGVALGPAFVIALGIAIVAFAVRRPAIES